MPRTDNLLIWEVDNGLIFHIGKIIKEESLKLIFNEYLSFMTDDQKPITIITSDFFPDWAYALSIILPVGGCVCIFLLNNYVFFIVAIVLSGLIWFTRTYTEFDPRQKKYRKGISLFGLKSGKWKPLEISGGYLAFQHYTESANYSFGGMFRTDVDEPVFELRLVYPNASFRTLVHGRELEAVKKMLLLGKLLSETYNVNFRDFVKGVVNKIEI